MAVFSVLYINGDKENIPANSSSAPPGVTNPAAPFSKKRKSRTPLEDITTLLYPELAPLSKAIHSGSDTPMPCLAYRLSIRRKKVCISNSRNSSPVAEALRKHFR